MIYLETSFLQAYCVSQHASADLNFGISEPSMRRPRSTPANRSPEWPRTFKNHNQCSFVGGGVNVELEEKRRDGGGYSFAAGQCDHNISIALHESLCSACHVRFYSTCHSCLPRDNLKHQTLTLGRLAHTCALWLMAWCDHQAEHQKLNIRNQMT